MLKCREDNLRDKLKRNIEYKNKLGTLYACIKNCFQSSLPNDDFSIDSYKWIGVKMITCWYGEWISFNPSFKYKHLFNSSENCLSKENIF